MKKKYISGIIIVSVILIVGIVGGVTYIKNRKNNNTKTYEMKKEKVQTNNIASGVVKKESKKSEENDKQEVLKIIKRYDYLAGKVNNQNIIINLEDGKIDNNKIETTAVYSENADVKLKALIESVGQDKCIISVLYNNAIIGKYDLKIEGNEAKGTFENMNKDKDQIDVELCFTNDVKKYTEEKIITMGFVEDRVEEELIKTQNKQLEGLLGEPVKGISTVSEKEAGEVAEAYLSKLPNGVVDENIPYKDVIYLMNFGAKNDTVVDSGEPRDTKLNKPDYKIDGVPAWLIVISPGTDRVSGLWNKIYENLLIDANGKIYTKDEFLNDVKEGEVLGLNEEGTKYVEVNNDYMKKRGYYTKDNDPLGGNSRCGGMVYKGGEY